MPRVSGPEPRTSTSSPVSLAVAWMSSGFRSCASASAIAQAAASAPSRPGARIGQRSIATRSCALSDAKADLDDVAPPAAGMKDGAAAALAVRIDDVVDRRVEPDLRQRLDHQRALPVAIVRGVPVLQRAAAADAEMRTDRRDPLGARDVDADQVTAIRMAGPGLDLGGLARQRIGHVERACRRVRDAVAAMAEPGDDDALSHDAPRSGIRDCRRRR